MPITKYVRTTNMQYPKLLILYIIYYVKLYSLTVMLQRSA